MSRWNPPTFLPGHATIGLRFDANEATGIAGARTTAGLLREGRSDFAEDWPFPPLRERARLYNRIGRGVGACRRPLKGRVFPNLEFNMKFAISLCAMTMLGVGAAQAQVDLKSYADANGNLDIQALTCAQLAGTWQEDADFMTVWYSGWYNGLAGYSKMKVDRAKELEHRVIVYCKAHHDVKVIKAMDINIKQMRKEAGIKVNDEQ